MYQPNSQNSFDPQPPASLSPYALSSLNALAHGGTSNSTFIPGEDPAHFFALIDNAFVQHKPGNDQDSGIVLDSVLARWYLSRRQRIQSDYECQLHKEYTDPTFWSDASLNRLNLFDRYKTTAERAFRRALVNVQTIHKQAMNDQVWQLKLATAKLKYETERQIFEAAEARREESRKVEEMMAAAHESNKPIHAVKVDEDGVCFIEQRVFISVEDGETVIDMLSPSNQEVRALIHQTKDNPNPPRQIHRYYHFHNNEVPAEFEFLFDDDEPLPEEDDDEEFHLDAVSFDEWRSRAKTEVCKLLQA